MGIDLDSTVLGRSGSVASVRRSGLAVRAVTLRRSSTFFCSSRRTSVLVSQLVSTDVVASCPRDHIRVESEYDLM